MGTTRSLTSEVVIEGFERLAYDAPIGVWYREDEEGRLVFTPGRADGALLALGTPVWVLVPKGYVERAERLLAQQEG